MRLGKEQSTGIACDEEDPAVLDPHAAVDHHDTPALAMPAAGGGALVSSREAAIALEAR